MSYTVDDITNLATTFVAPGIAWEGLYNLLQMGASVGLPGIGIATLVEAHTPEKEEGARMPQAYFVFEVRSFSGVRHFKHCGYVTSYDGIHWGGDTFEVKAAPVQKNDWRSI
ncbi:hypothetical protein I3U64_00375 [Mycobacteroides abscessus subsp. abscessus]|uniref:hypothetical protein n=1 Tax=Mycobacteroides abscessus TaxID=36809 RepID=UPI0005E24DB8|nr:hypothetical protein [Mycobacteroides abscessus]QSM02368.1 hypothetical protein PROPHIGD86-1_94 [Mycobacterium phage prophi86-1]MBN7458601.1 hypothetical protein [Mycobacteroides abscessus subsp. abscessus]CPS09933.1 Uncharacterised protein [Mycobacteroides abscessus]CPU99152.1 Uncharacterised protein [Mycobacteroides abscessus]SLJ45639.1 Uncharacterised protein [Mycobacteroides abscessus subsp. abscessus]